MEGEVGRQLPRRRGYSTREGNVKAAGLKRRYPSAFSTRIRSQALNST